MSYHPAAPTPAAPIEKKSKKWRWILGVPALLIVLSIFANLGDHEPKTTEPVATDSAGAPGAPDAPDAPAVPDAPVVPNASEPEPDAPAALPGIGMPVRDGKFEFTVTNVESGLAAVGDNPYLVEKAQGQFTIVTVSVLNTSNEPKGLSPDSQEMYDAEGRKFSADTSAAIGLDTDVAIWDEINPGNSVSMKVVFDMPVGAVPAEIELHDSMFSRGTRVSLR
ncbi:DUF4352 domain-containing protein [Rhodococcus sp. 114MFTsu3.1]|uniref:DUF4352 domain-containing protein n=1 Tax=Rhodococcus sp. 114MFTsu3.1 TaxID=1172184 RepID=UPI0003798E54|nr:DUF4352 domain-containing protein [Rhodococcus sp. 114MFTsu3.1]